MREVPFAMKGIPELFDSAADLLHLDRYVIQENAWPSPHVVRTQVRFLAFGQVVSKLCARLRGTPVRLEEALGGCSRANVIAKSEEKWSVQEHAGHLADLEPLWLARLEDYAAGAEQLTVADLTNRKTHEVKR